MSEKKLYEKLIEEFGKRGIKQIELPFIQENLTRELRDYQKEALQFYLANFESLKERHLMFNMATGSGKTLLMAALMLDLYARGYRDFIFFVNSASILEKTKANFADPNSSKYLFKNPIVLDSCNVEINLISHFDESKEDCINLCFTTIQKLFSILSEDRENSVSLQDFENRKIVFLADEAHHLNSDTKKSSKTQNEEKEGWELVVKKAFESHDESLLFEFSATIPQDPKVLDKYRDKIIYEYNLAKFCQEGYSKRIFLMRYEDLALEARFLGGILLSLFRELLAQNYGITLKPVILFKSEKIEASKENQKRFLAFLEEMDSSVIEEFYRSIHLHQNEFFKRSFDFFKNEFGEGFSQKIVQFLKSNFKATYLLNTNDEKELEKNQILLNSLEDTDNVIRVIFAVDKLNEGWDVLNLFDIVRLGNVKSKAITTKEAQLIGRGARYCPLESQTLELDPLKIYQRKFDCDLQSDLSMLERLSYHTINDVEFIHQLNEAMQKQGLSIEEKHCMRLSPNKKVLQTLKGKVIYLKNNRIKKQYLSHFRIKKEEIQQKMLELKIPLFSSNIQEKEERFEGAQEEQEFQNASKIENKIKAKYFLKAMNILHLTFEELSKNFDFKSKEEFIREYLGKITFLFSRKQDFSDPNNQLKIAKFILEHFKTIKEKIKSEFEVTPFNAYEFVINDRVIYRTKDLEKDFNYDWLYYTKCSFDSHLEEKFLQFIEARKEQISKSFSEWFIIRNERFEEFKLYDNREDKPTYARGLEPDFIFFGKRRGEEEIIGLQCFIEAKGEHLLEADAWKEEFLQTLRESNTIKNISLHGFPFFVGESKKQRQQRFDIAFEQFLKHNDYAN